MLLFLDKVVFYVSCLVCWDSDYVVILDDELKEIVKEIVRNDVLDKVIIGLDFFDVSINCIVVWVIGIRNMIKVLLLVMLMFYEELRKL